MECTGERYLPDLQGDWVPEHSHRYALAATLCAGKDVLDVACGEGYGSAHLAGVARSVVGVDIAEEAVHHARERYVAPNLEYRQGSAADLKTAGLADHAFDVVVSFETIEHLHEHEAMLDELRRVLRPDGLLIISSPDKLEYTDVPGYQNEYHVRELYRAEFEALVASRFSHHRIYSQRLEYGSLIVAEEPAPFASFSPSGQETVCEEHLSHAVYHIALASQKPVPLLPHSVWKYSVEKSDHAAMLRHKFEEMQEYAHVLEDRVREGEACILEQEARLRELTALVDGHAQHIVKLEDSIHGLGDQIHALERLNEDLQGQNQHLQGRIQEMEQSRSWKITAPLRRLSALLR